MKQALLTVIILLVSQILSAQSLKILEQSDRTASANISVFIKDVNTGKVIEDYRSANVVPPASVMKLFTTAAILEILGADYRYATYLEYKGKLINGVLHGDLYIRGTGDPTLGSTKVGDRAFLDKWVQAIQKAGITRIDGRIISDASFFNQEGYNPGWLWEDIGNYYAPGIYALSYLDNTMNITMSAGAAGTRAQVIRTYPEIPGLEVTSQVECVRSGGEGVYVHGMPGVNSRVLMGSVNAGTQSFGMRGDLPNPPMLLAQHLRSRLNAAGVLVSGNAAVYMEGIDTTRLLIYTWLSEPLSEIVKETNIHSNNQYAEMLFRTLAARIKIPCSIANSILVMQSFWQSHGVRTNNLTMLDGCGLAPQNAISAKAFVELLTYMRNASTYDAFYASLPISGQSGTLRSLLVGTELEGRVRAKSGTIKGTKNFAGYIELPNGDQWAFSILISGGAGKARDIQTVIGKYLLSVYQQHR